MPRGATRAAGESTPSAEPVRARALLAMTSIDKLAIRGCAFPLILSFTPHARSSPHLTRHRAFPPRGRSIRSFSPNEAQVIEFYKPLTLCARMRPAHRRSHARRPPGRPRATSVRAHTLTWLCCRIVCRCGARAASSAKTDRARRCAPVPAHQLAGLAPPPHRPPQFWPPPPPPHPRRRRVLPHARVLWTPCAPADHHRDAADGVDGRPAARLQGRAGVHQRSQRPRHLGGALAVLPHHHRATSRAGLQPAGARVLMRARRSRRRSSSS